MKFLLSFISFILPISVGATFIEKKTESIVNINDENNWNLVNEDLFSDIKFEQFSSYSNKKFESLNDFILKKINKYKIKNIEWKIFVGNSEVNFSNSFSPYIFPEFTIIFKNLNTGESKEINRKNLLYGYFNEILAKEKNINYISRFHFEDHPGKWELIDKVDLIENLYVNIEKILEIKIVDINNYLKNNSLSGKDFYLDKDDLKSMFNIKNIVNVFDISEEVLTNLFNVKENTTELIVNDLFNFKKISQIMGFSDVVSYASKKLYYDWDVSIHDNDFKKMGLNVDKTFLPNEFLPENFSKDTTLKVLRERIEYYFSYKLMRYHGTTFMNNDNVFDDLNNLKKEYKPFFEIHLQKTYGKPGPDKIWTDDKTVKDLWGFGDGTVHFQATIYDSLNDNLLVDEGIKKSGMSCQIYINVDKGEKNG